MSAITEKEFFARVEEEYGEAGLCAGESTCLTQDDFAKGYDHCIERITPALEEELLSRGELG